MNRENEKETADLPGFRLHRFEVLNWGTFDSKIWALDTAGANSLLTGDIGSGKSTLVDALTTLLVPAGRITYNKAAGAEGKERSLTDYILGQYKKEKDTEALQARAVSLREKDKALTILLGRFYDRNFNETVTLAQVFWLKEGKNQPERFFVISSDALTIENDLYQPGTDVLALKKKLKCLPSVEVYDTYTSYSAEFRRRMAIQSSQAIELFYQTVSMKSIGNLTDFVRLHMLEETPVQEKIDTMCRNFTNLNQAHEAVLRARHQIEALTPMICECDRYDEIEEEISGMRRGRDSLYSYMASIKKGLLTSKIERLNDEKLKISGRIDKISKETDNLETAKEKVRRDIEDNGGRRLAELGREIRELDDERKRRKDRSSLYRDLGSRIGISMPDDDSSFHENLSLVKEKISDFEEQQKEKREEETEIKFNLRRLDEEFKAIEKELRSLRQHPSNIPARNLEMRRGLCEALGVNEEEIPFAGELIEIRDEESSWEGALERVLHNFGLSLLVSDEMYGAVSDYVDRTNLRGRLVYYRVKDKTEKNIQPPDTDHLINKIRIKGDTPFYRWIEDEILSRFDYSCCDTMDDFRHHKKAVTKSGQTKSGGVRHEKDDRHNINDRTRYVLGWKNEQKIILLEKELTAIETGGKKIDELQKSAVQLKELDDLRDCARDLTSIQNFNEVDWRSTALKIEEHMAEIKEIEESADILQTLQEQLNRIVNELGDKQIKKSSLLEKQGELNNQLTGSRESLAETEEVFNSVEAAVREQTFPFIDGIKDKIIPDKKITLPSIESTQKELREYIQRQADNLSEQNKRRNSSISRQMQSYKDKYPLETSEIDASIEAAGEFRKILGELISQDLPRHEERFKRLLREGTIQDIALFQNQMEKERIEIKNKIDIINGSLREIDYNRGSYITLIPDRTLDQEIRQFREDLRLCMGETLGNSNEDIYTETKFRQVKDLIDRFQGRPGLGDFDKKWTSKVTDVRNWFIFSASERWSDDDSEKEFYSDSSGKSGGQKEKLAYTILAAALAFQFSLVKDGLWNRSFRFVMIDEAFGRGSDESARYGLELFRKLQLQLLIVTPLQKIHVIEDYVNSVHFVYQDGNRSLVGNMTIEDYRKQKEERNQTAE